MTPAELTIANGGGTFRADTLDPVELPAHKCSMDRSCGAWGEDRRFEAHRAYAVALSGRTFRIDGASIETIDGAIRRMIEPRPFDFDPTYDAPYIGTWIDNGTLFVDRVIILPDLASAAVVAATFRQAAIYDFANGVSIPVERGGGWPEAADGGEMCMHDGIEDASDCPHADR